MRPDPESASGKSGPITSVIVSNPGGDFQVIVKSANGNCIIHMASLADALSLKAQINGAQTTTLSCFDLTGGYKLPSPPTSTQYFTLIASP